MKFLKIGWVIALAIVMALALLPADHLQLPVFNWWDKAQHALAFAALTGWAQWIWPLQRLRLALVMMAYGAAIEAAQWAVGWRFAEWEDYLADAFGVILAWTLISIWQRLPVGAHQKT